MDELLVEIENIKKSWEKEREDACFKGTKYHERKEEQAYNRGFEINPYTREKTITKIKKSPPGNKTLPFKDLWELEDGYYPELIIWNDLYEIAGTADKVFIYTKGKKRYVDIDDFKTNKEIKKQNNYQKMKYPIEKLDDCNYNHYRLQISMYAWMLEQFGFIVKNVGFTHMNELYKFQYGRMKPNIIKLLKNYSNER